MKENFASGGTVNPLLKRHPLRPPWALLLLACFLSFAGRQWAASTQPCVTIKCSTNIIAQCENTNGAVVSFPTPNASSDCGRAVTVTCKPSSGSLFPPGVTTVLCLAKDSLNNTGACDFAVSVVGLRPPTIEAPTNIEAQCMGPTGAVVTFTATATSVCDPAPQLSCVPASGSVFPIGTTTVRCVATDLWSHAVTNSFPVRVSGECDPACLVMNCPRGFELRVGHGNERFVEYDDPSASNTCSGVAARVQCIPPSGSAFPVGTNVVTCSAQSHGIIQTCQFMIVIEDDVAPVLAAPGVVTVPCEGLVQTPSGDEAAGAFVEFNVVATDNVDPLVPVVCTPQSGSFFPVGTNLVTCLAADNANNRAQISFAVVVESGPACEVESFPGGLAPEPDNWGFELGLKSWRAHGTAFFTNQQPVWDDRITTKRIADEKQRLESNIGGDYWRDLGYPIGHRGRRWIGSGEYRLLGHGELRDVATGWLRSKPFKIEKENINFLCGGTWDLATIRVELLVETNSASPFAEQMEGGFFYVAEQATGHGKETMRRCNWDVSGYMGKQACLRIRDDSTSGHINVDDFRFDHLPPAQQTVNIGGKVYPAVVTMEGYEYDWDSPVWGFADLHTHPMSSFGFGGKLVHGKADGDLSSLGDCNCSHGGWGFFDNQCGDYWREIIQKAMDDKGNNPHREGWVNSGDDWQWKQFRNWPVFSSIGHQQMWHDWVKRAHEGGLRVMVALCVNNPLLAHAGKGDLPGDDKWVGNKQIMELTNFVANHDFLEIAYDPYQLRDIVRRGKLAIIIGSELDDIGNFASNPLVDINNPSPVAKELVRGEIQRLYNHGVRYIFPVHLMDNKFGGTAVGSDMLNMATKHLMGRPFSVTNASAADGINYHLTDFNEVEIGGQTIDVDVLAATGAAAGVALGPLLFPTVGILADAFGATPPGAGAGTASALMPFAAIGMMGALPAFIATVADSPVPLNVAPLPGNYPHYPNESKAPYGVRNTYGLSSLGNFAVGEMMKLGMMIDVDHMSQNTITNVFAKAESNPIGYPLNSGHNSFRELGLEVNENHRSVGVLDRICYLGGMMGVGWENGPARTFAEKVPYPRWSGSHIDNNCGGTSKSFGQLYLYAMEHMHASHIALGTDIDGLIPTPGPRFGPQGAFGLPDKSPVGNENALDRAYQIGEQKNGVLYEPKHGKPLTSPAFVGKAVDPDREKDAPRFNKGYRYNKDQRDFYAAIRIFHWFCPNWPQEVTLSASAMKDILESIHDGLSDSYGDKDRVKDYAAGMIRGYKGWPLESDGETHRRQQIGKAVVFQQMLGQSMWSSFGDDSEAHARFAFQVNVWNDYHRIFGDNTPMKRCTTDRKEWDVNFEGVAHYGLVPDFLQDLKNVGLQSGDMSVLFRSAEHFAQMWTKTLNAAAWARPHFLPVKYVQSATGGRELELTIDTTDETAEVEETDTPGNPRSWRPASLSEVQTTETGLRIVHAPFVGTAKFYRLKPTQITTH